MKMFSSPLTVQNFALGALTHPISSSAIHIAFEDPFCLPASLYNVMPDMLHWRLVAAPPLQSPLHLAALQAVQEWEVH
jgi:hypothetical protein